MRRRKKQVAMASERTYNDFVNMGLNNLKDYLTIRGISVSVYKKAELVARAFSAHGMGLPVILSTEEQAKVLKKDYRKRLIEFGLSDPLEISADKKIDDMTTWPPISLGHIFEYILNVRDFNTEYIGKYKDQKAFSYFDSGFVGEILTYQNETIYVLYCNVTASMSIHEEKELWVAVKHEGKIVTAWCSCMAGASRCCNHVIATLYKVEYANTHGYCSPACTSVPCGWNKSTKTIIEPKKISDIVIRKKLRSKMGKVPEVGVELCRENTRMIELNKFDPRERLLQNMTGERLSLLLHGLSKSNPNAVLFKSVEGISIPSTKSHNLSITGIANEIINSNENQSPSDQVTTLLKQLCFSEKEVATVEKLTRDQSNSAEWMEHRKGRLTASKHYEYYTKINTVLKCRTVARPKTTNLVASLLFRDQNLEHIEAIKWGISKEKDPLKQFYAEEATKHVDFKLESCGLFLDKDRAYIGASPDSIMLCKCHGKSVIEIKCPFNIKDLKIKDGLEKCDFFTLIDSKLSLKKNHKYHAQINSQIALTNSTGGYFVTWTLKDLFI